jgi:hypothetical protein
MKIQLPEEIEGFFNTVSLSNWPKLPIPQSFTDDRGTILNIADGALGDVAIIHSNTNSIRANHVHETDWHLSFCAKGGLIYSYVSIDSKVVRVEIAEGELFFTPSGVPHRMDFLTETTLVVASRNSRTSEKYDLDTSKYLVSDPRGLE